MYNIIPYISVVDYWFTCSWKRSQKGRFGAFITAASLQYQALDEGEKARLETAAENFTEERNLTLAARRKMATKIFKKIQTQVIKSPLQ